MSEFCDCVPPGVVLKLDSVSVVQPTYPTVGKGKQRIYETVAQVWGWGGVVGIVASCFGDSSRAPLGFS